MGNRSLSRLGMAALAGALALAVIAAAASGRPARITLHFFQKPETFSFTDSAGHPIGANQLPPVGSIFRATDRDYVGNHKHHAKNYSATDHVRCVVTGGLSAGGALPAKCDGQIAVGGSMFLADGVTSSLAQNSTTVPISGGTGRYQGYKGVAKSVVINSKSNDLTVTVHR